MPRLAQSSMATVMFWRAGSRKRPERRARGADATPLAEASGRLRNPARRRRASAVVEFALVAVVLGMVVAGMIELAHAMTIKSILTDASRRGASTAAAANKIYSDIQNDVDDVLSTDNQLPATLANGKATLTVKVAPWNSATQTYGADVVVTSSTFAPNQYDKISVKVSVQASDVAWLFLNYTKGLVESETVVMMKQ